MKKFVINSKSEGTRQISKINKFGNTLLKNPIWRCCMCIILSFVLTFGMGTNLCYAAEFLPKDSQPEKITMLQTDSKTIEAPQDGSSYMWQIQLAESDTYVTIPEASDKQFTFNAGLIDNDDVLKDGVAMLRCNVIDENGEWIAQQLYQVTYLKTLDNLAADNSEEIADALKNPVDYDDVINSDENKDEGSCNISVQYYTGSEEYPIVVGAPISKDFGINEDFTWKIQSKTYLGKVKNVSIADPSQAACLIITYDEGSITLKYNNLELPESIKVNVLVGEAEAKYKIEKYLQNTEQTEWVNVLNEDRTGTIGTYVPNSSKGERDISGGIRVQEVGMNIKSDDTAKAEVYFTRKYTLAEFDTEGCVQAPEPRYNMYGKKMYDQTEIVEVSDGVYSPGPVPVRIGFTFKGWYIGEDDTKIISEDEWKNMTYQSENVTFKAKWEQDSDKAQVTIYYLGQNAEQIGEVTDPDYFDKNFSWIAERYKLECPVGEEYFVADQDIDPGYARLDESEYNGKYPEYFQCGNHIRTQAAKIEDGDVVKNDGSTYVKVYLFRNTYEWKFYDAGPQTATEPPQKWWPVVPSDTSTEIGSISARWGKDISDEFKSITKQIWDVDSYPWWVYEGDPSKSETVSLQVYMDRTNRNSYESCFEKCYIEGSYISHARYYVQNLNKPFAGHASVKEEDTSGNFTLAYDAAAGKGANVTYGDFLNLTGFDKPAYDDVDGPYLEWNEEDQQLEGEEYSTHGFSFYYKRHTHKLYLAFIKGDGEGQEAVYRTVDNVPYDLPLADVQVQTEDGTVSLKNYIPEKYEGVDPNYVFAGWTLDSNTDEGKIIDWETDKLTMQDYDSNIYAKWVAPEVSVSLDNTAPFQPGTKITSMNEHYASNIQVGIPEVPEDSSGRYVFKSWYYLKDLKQEDEPSNRVYFDPSNMPIPAEVIGRATADNLDMDLKLEYTDTQLCSYKIRYVYKNENGEEVELATPTEGAGRVGEEYAFDVYPRSSSDLFPDYVGMYTARESSHKMILKFNQENEYTFYYDLTGTFKYKVEYWDSTTDSEIFNIEHKNYSPNNRTATEKAIDPSTDDHLKGVYTLDDELYKTIVLVADESETEWNNIIRFNYVQQTTELHYRVSSASSENGGTLECHDQEKQTIDSNGTIHEANILIKTQDSAIGVSATPNDDWQFDYWYMEDTQGNRIEWWTSPEKNLIPNKKDIFGENQNWQSYTFVAVFSYSVFNINIVNHFKDDDSELKNTGGVRLVQNQNGKDVTLADVKDGQALELQVTNASTYAYKYDKDATNNIRETIYMTDVRYKNEDGEWVKGSGQFMIVAYDHTGAKYAFDKWQLNNTDAKVTLDSQGQVIPEKFEYGKEVKGYKFDSYYQRRYLTLTTTSDEHGSIEPEESKGDLAIPYDEKITFTNDNVIFDEMTEYNFSANPNEHYVFDHWGIIEDGKPEYTAPGTFTFVQKTTIKAYFVLQKFKTTYTVAEENTGTLTNASDGNFDYGTNYRVDASSNSLFVGDTEIKVTANAGYKFEKWTLKDSDDAITSGTIQADTNFVVHFVEGDSFTITYKAIYWKGGQEAVIDTDGRAGHIEWATSGVLEQTCFPISGVDGFAPTCQAVPKTGFKLENWYVLNSENVPVPCTNVKDGKLTVDKNGGVYVPDTYYASFEEDQSGDSDVAISYDIKTLNANGDDISNNYTGGKVGPSSIVHPATGSPSSTAEANAGYKFVNWVDADGKEVTTNTTIQPQWDPAQRIFVATTYTAVFQELSDTVKVNYKAMAQDRNGNLIPGFAGGSVSPSQSSVTPVTGQPAQATATESIDGFKFVGWYFQNPNNKSLDPKSIEKNFTPTKGNNEIWVDDVTYVALFKENQIEITYGVLTCSKEDLSKIYENAGGAITKAGELVYPYSDTCSGTSVDSINNGYHFLKWVKKTTEGTYVDTGVTTQAFTPQKEDGVYKPAEYYAVFTTYDVTIHVCVANQESIYHYGNVYHNGQKVTGEYKNTIESASSYQISSEGTISFYSQASDPQLLDQLTVQAFDNCNYIGYVLNEQVTAASSFGVVYGTEEQPYPEYYKNNEYFISAFVTNGTFWMSYEVDADSRVGDSQCMGAVGLGENPSSYFNNCHEEITAAADSVQGAKAKANNGYVFDYWTKDDDTTQIKTEYVHPEKDGEIYKPHKYYAHFKECDPVTINYGVDCDVSVEGVNPGSVSSVSESVLPASETAKGSKATAAEGFEFEYWYYTNTAGEKITFSGQWLNPQKEDGVYVPRTYTAHFKQLTNIQVTYKVEDKYPDIDPGEVAIGKYPETGYATSVSETNIASITGNLHGATARAFNGFIFKGWRTESSELVTSDYYLPRKADSAPWKTITYIAVFEENTSSYTYSVKTWNNAGTKEFTDLSGGTLDRSFESIPSVTGSVAGANLTKKSGFIFDGWFDENNVQVADSSVLNFIPKKEGDPHKAFVSHQYYAKFHEDADITITYKVKQLNDQSGDLWPGLIDGKTTFQEDVAPVSEVPVGATVTPNQGYAFVGWYAEGSTTAASTNLTFVPQKSLGVYSSVTYNAVFKANEQTNYKVRYWFQDYDKQNYSQRTEKYPDKKFNDLKTETKIIDFSRYYIDGGVPGFKVADTSPVVIIGSDPNDESTWTTIDIKYDLKDDMQFSVNVYLQEDYVYGDTEKYYKYEKECFRSYKNKTTGSWLNVADYNYAEEWKEYSWEYDHIIANTAVSKDGTQFQVGEGETIINLYYDLIPTAKYTVNLYQNKLDNNGDEQWENEPFKTITDLQYYPATTFKPHIDLAGYDYYNSEEGRIIPNAEHKQAEFKVYMNRKTDIQYKLVYMIQNYNKDTGEVLEGYHPAQDDDYYQQLVGENNFTYILNDGITATKVRGNTLSDELWNRELLGFSAVDKYDAEIDGEGWCTVNGEGLENIEESNQDWWMGRNIIRRYYNKKMFTLRIKYVIPDGFDTSNLPGDYLKYNCMVNESYSVNSPDYYSTLTLKPDREVVSGVMSTDNIEEIVNYHETKLIHVDNVTNDASLGWVDEPTFEYGYYHGLHNGETHDITAHANDNAHFVCWKNDADEVVSTSPTLTLKREIDESDPKPVDISNSENQVMITAKYTAVFGANPSPTPVPPQPDEPGYDNPDYYNVANTGDLTMLAFIFNSLVLFVAASILTNRKFRKKQK